MEPSDCYETLGRNKAAAHGKLLGVLRAPKSQTLESMLQFSEPRNNRKV